MTALSTAVASFAAALAAIGHGPPPPTPVDGTGAAFADSVGVNTHEFYLDTAYVDKPRLEGLLLDLGVRHVRDNLRYGLEPYGVDYTSARATAAGGVKFDWIAGWPPDRRHAVDATSLLSDPTKLGGTAEALEGPNEYDALRRPSPRTGRDPVWAARLFAFMAEYYWTFKADWRFGALPFWGPSFLSDAGRDEYAATPGARETMDRPNAHAYSGGRVPEPTIDATVRRYADAFGGRKPVISETGYHTATNVRVGHYGVSERAQAIYTERALLTAFADGAPRTYLYQLLDTRPEPGLRDMEEHFGLVGVEGDPAAAPATWTIRRKPAFDTLKELLRVERDPGREGVPTHLAYWLSGGIGVRDVLLARSRGVVDLVLWDPAPVYDPGRGDTFPADVPVTLRLGEPADVAVEHPYGERAFTALGRGTSFALRVRADPVVVRIAPGSAGPE